MNITDVTIIIPTYVYDDKSLSYLHEAVRSAIDQGCHVIVFDDGSPIDCKKELSKYSSNLFHAYGYAENRGVSTARNEAVKKVTTPLIYPLDCDDTLNPGAVKELVENWNGVPVYSDLMKFGAVPNRYHRVLDFSCDLVYQKLGIASVNVLHSVEQWKSIGGWDESINYYEDAEYNARLFLRYCAVCVHKGLINYRQHLSQKTRRLPDDNQHILRATLNRIRRYDMACPGCGKKRSIVRITNPSAQQPTQVDFSSVASLPGEKDGRILAQYLGGKGKASHYYRGPKTNYPYKVIYEQFYYVDPSDARFPTDPPQKSFLVRKSIDSAPQAVTAAAAKPPVTEKSASVVERTPVADMKRSPAVADLPDEAYLPKEVNDLPDIGNMSYMEIRLLDPSVEDAGKLLTIEKRGRNRERVVSYLSKRVAKEE